MNSVLFMQQVTDFIAKHSDHPMVVEYNKGNIGLGYIIRNWDKLTNETNSTVWDWESWQDDSGTHNLQRGIQAGLPSCDCAFCPGHQDGCG
jgi:hypothetical protein